MIVVTAVTENEYNVTVETSPINISADPSSGKQGIQGPVGVGVPAGGTTNQRLAKIDDTDYNTEWVDFAPPGLDGEVLYNDGGEFGADAQFRYDHDLKALCVGKPVVIQDNPLALGGDVDSYLQANIQNKNDGIKASADYVATADNGDDTQNYIDMGINNSNALDPEWDANEQNDGYVYVNGQNLNIGTDVADKDIYLITGGFMKANRRARVCDTGIDMVGAHKLSENGFNLTDLITEASNAIEEAAAFAAGSKIVIRTDLI